ncbi:MAG: exonuclease SbcCD subunit D C-terminal domain-containing protein [Fluviicoccus sp.]|uniref:exonuclease SbcCD subunit D C-terminal domain-containing protein n=1 Tax=Fluviicoccus sp. TaxID=2003552 RepID=UPI0027156D16|nr:exonuclease SbcCD subunit D C-terminal domain-containing protein [Fluviicoccus sp.]MDO8329652.1 exonuclease SbcCD subunit D C-terminal domain-containing protein [Fluviicoccus sp.]
MNQNKLRLLHTSDWHLGRLLYGRKRYTEFAEFLDWLLATLRAEQIDVLLVAGDIFDTSTPSNAAQALYYRFLRRVADTGCRHVVVIGGNHDSPTFLDAPAELLKMLDVHVVGAATDNPADEVIALRDADGHVELLACAVPYLRDRDLRTAEAGESPEDKERKLAEGIKRHYAAVVEAAMQVNQSLPQPVPVVGLGHLFTAGGQTVDGDGVRELYVGSLAHVTAGIFPEALDYVALGHLHVPQAVGGREFVRYSGSPLAMGFGEAAQAKQVCVVEFAPEKAVRLLPVPVFQDLERVAGDWPQIEARLTALKAAGSSAWLEVTHTGHELIDDLRERLDALVAGSALEILKSRDARKSLQVLNRQVQDEALDDLSPGEVFARCLEAGDVPPEQRDELKQSFGEILQGLQETDERAE